MSSGDEDNMTKCGYDTSNRRTPYDINFLNRKFPSEMESKRMQPSVTAGAATFQNPAANNDDVMNKIKAVVEHRIEVLNLSVRDASAITGIIFLLVILHNYPIMTIAIVTWIAYRHSMS
jgi:hypothetical protein